MRKVSRKHRVVIGALATLLVIFLLTFSAYRSSQKISNAYEARRSTLLFDRKGTIIAVQPNKLGNYAIHSPVSSRFSQLILASEDRFFWFHPGLNPVSILRAIWHKLARSGNPASSTITQQLVKILLLNENDRGLKNKLLESWYTLAVELFHTKQQILGMYANSIYFGNHAEGLRAASQIYFEKTPELLSDNEMLELVATITNPATGHPFSTNNAEKTAALAQRLHLSYSAAEKLTLKDIGEKKNNFQNFVSDPSVFELGKTNCENDCHFTIDAELTKKLRSILNRQLESLANKNVTNGAIVVLKLPENELLAMVGTPDPTGQINGQQINMATAPRPIGSTIKPLIYLKGFEKGLRPYSLVDDQEYRYSVGNGFPFYPKNYDREYHGRLTLHYALTNSLNVPTVKVLEYLGLPEFYDFLHHDLGFTPIQPFDHYELGIALGGLEMSLFDLTDYLSILPNNGTLRPVTMTTPPNQAADKKITDQKYTQLVTKILNDRLTGVDQFSLKSALNLPWPNYAVKTGTSRDFHDSWTVGYTSDFIVGVWVGNTDNTPMDSVSGLIGAGNIWHDSMSLVYNSPYNHHTPFQFDLIKATTTAADTVDYGLPGDNLQKHLNLLLSDDPIVSPHDGDTFLLEAKTAIPLQANEEVTWLVDDKTLGTGSEVIFYPTKRGRFQVVARGTTKSETISILVN